jgi:hypothetical protein
MAVHANHQQQHACHHKLHAPHWQGLQQRCANRRS